MQRQSNWRPGGLLAAEEGEGDCCSLALTGSDHFCCRCSSWAGVVAAAASSAAAAIVVAGGGAAAQWWGGIASRKAPSLALC